MADQSKRRLARALTRGVTGMGFGAFIGIIVAFLVKWAFADSYRYVIGGGRDWVLFLGFALMVAVPFFVFEFYRTWKGM